ncbi:MAG TPA: hypothetical protein VF952_12175 [Chloroflexia bacterium]
MHSDKSMRGRRFLCRVLLVLVLSALLPGCAEVLPEAAPRAEVVSDGLGATRQVWEHEHKLAASFERDMDYTRLKGLLYEDGYRVTYWVDGPQEAAPASARISRLEFDTPERDHEVLKAIIQELLPQDAVLSDFYGPYGDTSDFTERFEAPSLESVYEPLAYTKNPYLGGEHLFSMVVVRYSGSKPNVVIEIGPWRGIPPESMPPPFSTVPVSLPMPVPSVYP